MQNIDSRWYAGRKYFASYVSSSNPAKVNFAFPSLDSNKIKYRGEEHRPTSSPSK